MSDPVGGSAEPAKRLPRDEVRRRILAAAAAEFTARGYDDARLDAIAQAAGFTKGAVYSNFGGKRELFAAVLTERADAEHEAVKADVDGVGIGAAVEAAAARVAGRIAGDPERGALGLEFAARATRDEQVREVFAPMRRAQREAAGEAVAAVAAQTGAQLTVDPALAGIILHCLTNGLSMEHLADPEALDAATVERALAAVMTLLTGDQER
ncbi:TetR/AcrR family transcriptional regulator [Glycomyces sp. NPDC047010]|uniref:TetR/AcrR family transcriptional regulator n=1 Tax=Glycomyces sp. NPDC047010 TaxID=3155023 RepID=UPI0033CE7CEF